MITVDPFTRQYKNADFDYNKYLAQNTTKKLNQYPPISAYKDRHGRKIYESTDLVKSGLQAGTLRLATANFSEKKKVAVPDAVANDIRLETFVPNRVAQLALATYTRIKIRIPGNNELTVGMTIDFSMPNTLPTGQAGNPEKEEDVMLSGKYIITAVRHMIKSGTPTTYETFLELAKDSLSGPLASVSNYTGGWHNAINGMVK